MSHLLKTGTSIFKVGNNIFKINDKLSVLIANKGGFGSAIEGLRFDPVAANHRVAISSGPNVKIVDSNDFSVIATINLGASVIGFAWDSPNNKLYVTTSSRLYIINTTTWVSTNSGLGNGSFTGVALDPNTANNRIIIAGGNRIHFVDLSSFAITTSMLTGFNGAYGIAFDPEATNRLYVGNYGSNYVAVVDTDNFAIVETIPGFSAPIDVAFDPNPDNARFLVSEYSGASVAYVSKGTRGIIKRVAVTNNPEGVSFDPNVANNRFINASASLGQYFLVSEILT